MATNRFFIETWGCQMNELDSQRLAGQLRRQGYRAVAAPEEADVILLNSCSVREKAEHKVFSRIGRFRELKQGNPKLTIGLCGCVAQQVGEQALRRSPDLDFVLGPGRVGELSEVLARRRTGERPVVTGFPQERPFDIDAISREGSYKGMVTVIEGCNKNCTFCIVPTTRGAERCRPIGDILTEVESLVGKGFLEIELLGQTVNHWRQPGGDLDFADLLDAVARIPGLERLRFVTSYPRDFTQAMADQVGRHENICPYLHLPVQSGSDRILRLMGRGYSTDGYRRVVSRLRRARPDLALSTDLIVGFPGETEADFTRTLELVEELRFSSIFAFVYSPRPGTAALRLPESVDPEVAAERLQILFQTQETIQRELNQSLVGTRQPVLITAPGRNSSTWSGRTACHRVVHFESDEKASGIAPGTIHPVIIDRALPHSLVGRAI